MQLSGAFPGAVEHLEGHSRFVHLSGALGKDVVQVHALLKAHAFSHMGNRDGERLMCGSKVVRMALDIPVCLAERASDGCRVTRFSMPSRQIRIMEGGAGRGTHAASSPHFI